MFGNGNGKAHKEDLDIDEYDKALIEQKVRNEVKEIKRKKQIEDLEARLAMLKEPEPKLEQVRAEPPKIAIGQPSIKFNDQGLGFFEDQPNVLFDPSQLALEIKQRNGIEDQPIAIETPKPKRPSLSLRKPKLDNVIYSHVTDETINLQAHSLMPNSDKLAFIDPKAVALPMKTVPAMKGVVQLMSTAVQKKPIDPRLLIGIGIAVVMASIGLVIVYNSIIVPQQNAERSYEALVRANGGNATGIAKPGGGLFKFEAPNPFAPCPTCPGGSNDPAKKVAPTPKPQTPTAPPAPTKTYQKDVIQYCQQFGMIEQDYQACVKERSDTLKLKAP